MSSLVFSTFVRKNKNFDIILKKILNFSRVKKCMKLKKRLAYLKLYKEVLKDAHLKTENKLQNLIEEMKVSANGFSAV